MRRVLRFIKTTAIGGLLVIIPVTIILFVLAQIFYGLYSVAAELIGQIPVDLRNEALFVAGITVASIIGLCFLTGLVVQTSVGVALKGWFGRNVANRIPMYNAIANLTNLRLYRQGRYGVRSRRGRSLPLRVARTRLPC